MKPEENTLRWKCHRNENFVGLHKVAILTQKFSYVLLGEWCSKDMECIDMEHFISFFFFHLLKKVLRRFPLNVRVVAAKIKLPKNTCSTVTF